MSKLDPRKAFYLAFQHHQAGRLKEAESLYRRILAVEPRHAEALHHLGLIARKVGKKQLALDLIRRAVALQPGNPASHTNLGNLLTDSGRFDDAIAEYRLALQLKPGCPKTHNNLAIALEGAGRFDDAIEESRRAIALHPEFAEAHNTLASSLSRKGKGEDSIAAFQRAISLRDEYAEAHYNLAKQLRIMGRFQESLAAHRRAITLRPGHAKSHNNLGNLLNELGMTDEAIAAYRLAQSIDPAYDKAHSNLLFVLNYHPGLDASDTAGEHRLWNQRHALPLSGSIMPHTNDRSPERRLRIGYVSPDFRNHSVAYFLEALLEQHDSSRVEVFCYSNVAKPDRVTARIQGLAAHWRPIRRQSDAEVADLIRTDGIDILVDLSGHTAQHSLLAFARKPAPVQVTWLGYPNTTGLDAIDHRITDAFADPPGSTEHLHSEQLLRLPRSGWCYRPFEDAPPVGAPPALTTGHITFACFNAMPKINRPLLELWAKILSAVPGSRLLLKNKSLGDPSVIERIGNLFGRSGITPERLELTGHVRDLGGHLASYGRADIALDTYPYHGTTTTCEALWMGVPVITLAGKTHVSRVGVSLLSNLGRPDWIAHSPDEYVDLAVELAGDLPRLAGLRTCLREEMQSSLLMDAPAFARDMEEAYRTMWRRWCGQTDSPPCPK